MSKNLKQNLFSDKYGNVIFKVLVTLEKKTQLKANLSAILVREYFYLERLRIT